CSPETLQLCLDVVKAIKSDAGLSPSTFIRSKDSTCSASTQPLRKHPTGHRYDTPHLQSTLGPLFAWRGNWYAIASRHMLLGADETVIYTALCDAPKRQVLFMGQERYDAFIYAIMREVSNLHFSVETMRRVLLEQASPQKDVFLERILADYERRLQRHGIALEQAMNDFNRLEDRVIGALDWAPEIAVNLPYTRDLCVVKLDKNRFQGFEENGVTLLNTQKPDSDIIIRMKAGFDWPFDGLLRLSGFLSLRQLQDFSENDPYPNACRYYQVTVRTYLSDEEFTTSWACGVLPHRGDRCPFSRGGDAGALIVDANGKAVALVTEGLKGQADSCDITYGTPFQWAFETVIQGQYPGADLFDF
ncbi:hypothetical protein BD626DRAFT_507772, partial [Schizophyllum amplum]